MAAYVVNIDNKFELVPFYNKDIALSYSKLLNKEESDEIFFCQITKSTTNRLNFDENFKNIIIAKISEKDPSQLRICDASSICDSGYGRFRKLTIPIQYLKNGVLKKIN